MSDKIVDMIWPADVTRAYNGRSGKVTLHEIQDAVTLGGSHVTHEPTGGGCRSVPIKQ